MEINNFEYRQLIITEENVKKLQALVVKNITEDAIWRKANSLSAPKDVIISLSDFDLIFGTMTEEIAKREFEKPIKNA